MVHSRKLFGSAVSAAVTLSLATAFVAAPAAIGVGPFADAAYAKDNGKGNGRGGGGRDKAERDRGGDRDKGGRGNGKGGGGKIGKNDKSDRENGRRAKSSGNPFKDFKRDVGSLFGKEDHTASKVKAAKVQKFAATDTKKPAKGHGKKHSGSVDEYGLHASDRKALNAKVDYHAIQNKIAHQNWNGISGQYAKLDLMTRTAEAYETGDLTSLSDEDLAALHSLGFDPESAILTDWEMDGAEQLDDTYPTVIDYDVMVNDDGTLTVTCGNCSEDGSIVYGDSELLLLDAEEVNAAIMAAEDDLNMQKEAEDLAAEDAYHTLDELYDHAEDSLLARSSYSGDETTGYAYLEGVNDHLNGSRDLTERSQEFSDYFNPDWPEPVELDPETTVIAEGEVVAEEF